MERNLNRRVEAVARVVDRAIVRHVRDVVLDAYLRDSDAAYTLDGDQYVRAVPDSATRVNAQQELLTWYTLRPSVVEAAD
jgi:polyphosphate kinase